MATPEMYYDNFTEIQTDPPREPTLKLHISVAISVVFLLMSLLCNFVVIFTVAKKSKLHQLPYIFLACIGICDIAASIGYSSVLANSFESFEKGLFLCRFIGFMLMYPEILKLLLFMGIAIYKVFDRTALMGRKGVGKSVLILAFLVLICVGLCTFPFIQIQYFSDGKWSYCDFYYSVFGVHLYSLIKYACFLISGVTVLTCLLVSRKRRREEVAEVDDDGLVVKNPQKADERFELMVLGAWIGFFITSVVIELDRQVLVYVIPFEWYQAVFMWVEPLIFYPETFYKVFLYKSKDVHF